MALLYDYCLSTCYHPVTTVITFIIVTATLNCFFAGVNQSTCLKIYSHLILGPVCLLESGFLLESEFRGK